MRGPGTDETESLTVRNQEMAGDRPFDLPGSGSACWWAAGGGSPDLPPGDPRRSRARPSLAVEIAKAAPRLPGQPVSCRRRARRHLAGPDARGPVHGAARGEGALLMEATRRMQLSQASRSPRAGLDLLPSLDLVRLERRGGDRTGVHLHSGGGTDAIAWGRRHAAPQLSPSCSVVTSRRRARNTSHARADRGVGAHRVGRPSTCCTAPECPSEVTTLVLDSGQVELQIHESIGHPIELDRVLGMEEAYAIDRNDEPA